MSDQDDLWGEEPFNDMPDETKLDAQGTPVAAPPARLPRPTAPVAQPPPQTFNDVNAVTAGASDGDVEELEDYEDAMADAHLRLEQGSLYKMIMNHELFEGMDADPKAVQNVQNEMRKFARERMEVMLGMRKETSTVEHLEIDFPFNALEVDVLKKLAFAATKGATQNSDNFVPEVKRTTAEVPNVARKTLNPISKPSAKKAQVKPLQASPAAPVKRPGAVALSATIEQIAREEGIPRELLEENVPAVGGKPLNKMTEQEIIDRNKITSQRRVKQVKSDSAIPMATQQQEEMLANQHVTAIGSSKSMQNLLNMVKNMPIKKE